MDFEMNILEVKPQDVKRHFERERSALSEKAKSIVVQKVPNTKSG
jgi:hypothetical protein